VGTALALGLAVSQPRLRGRLSLWSRRPTSVSALARGLRACPGFRRRIDELESAETALAGADVVLLCVAEPALEPLVRELARAAPSRRAPLPVVLHTNGYLGTSVLAPLARKGSPVGKLHPFVPVTNGLSLRGAHWGIGGDASARRAARQLVRQLGGHVLLPRPGSWDSYHAAATLLSGGSVALFDLADRVLARSIPDLHVRRAALQHLAHETLLNIGLNGPRDALTGALSRGAEDVVRGHLRALRCEPRALEVYRSLGRQMLDLARARGSLDARGAREMKRLLGPPVRKPRHRSAGG